MLVVFKVNRYWTKRRGEASEVPALLPIAPHPLQVNPSGEVRASTTRLVPAARIGFQLTVFHKFAAPASRAQLV